MNMMKPAMMKRIALTVAGGGDRLALLHSDLGFEENCNAPATVY